MEIYYLQLWVLQAYGSLVTEDSLKLSLTAVTSHYRNNMNFYILITNPCMNDGTEKARRRPGMRGKDGTM